MKFTLFTLIAIEICKSHIKKLLEFSTSTISLATKIILFESSKAVAVFCFTLCFASLQNSFAQKKNKNEILRPRFTIPTANPALVSVQVGTTTNIKLKASTSKLREKMFFIIRTPPKYGKIGGIFYSNNVLESNTATIQYISTAPPGVDRDSFTYAVKHPSSAVSKPARVTIKIFNNPSIIKIPNEINFGKTAIGELAKKKFKIENIGLKNFTGEVKIQSPFIISEINRQNPPDNSSINANQIPFDLPANSSLEYSIHFQASGLGNQEAFMIVIIGKNQKNVKIYAQVVLPFSTNTDKINLTSNDNAKLSIKNNSSKPIEINFFNKDNLLEIPDFIEIPAGKSKEITIKQKNTESNFHTFGETELLLSSTNFKKNINIKLSEPKTIDHKLEKEILTENLTETPPATPDLEKQEKTETETASPKNETKTEQIKPEKAQELVFHGIELKDNSTAKIFGNSQKDRLASIYGYHTKPRKFHRAIPKVTETKFTNYKPGELSIKITHPELPKGVKPNSPNSLSYELDFLKGHYDPKKRKFANYWLDPKYLGLKLEQKNKGDHSIIKISNLQINKKYTFCIYTRHQSGYYSMPTSGIAIYPPSAKSFPWLKFLLWALALLGFLIFSIKKKWHLKIIDLWAKKQKKLRQKREEKQKTKNQEKSLRYKIKSGKQGSANARIFNRQVFLSNSSKPVKTKPSPQPPTAKTTKLNPAKLAKEINKKHNAKTKKIIRKPLINTNKNKDKKD